MRSQLFLVISFFCRSRFQYVNKKFNYSQSYQPLVEVIFLIISISNHVTSFVSKYNSENDK